VNQQRVLLLTTLMLLSSSRLPGQAPRLYQDGQYGDPKVCNDGTITFSVARAARDYWDMGFGSNEWVIQGWYNVDPGKCTEIGEGFRYRAGGWFGEDSVTLLAFAFWDSKHAWRGIKVQPGDSGWFYPIYPSNQQICVTQDAFRYTRNSPKQIDLARACDGVAAGYILIPASFMYKGSTRGTPTVFDGPEDPYDYLHVKIGPDDRAITSGRTHGSAGISRGLDGAGTSHSNGDASPSLGTQLMKALAKHAAEERQKQEQAAAAAAAERQRQAQANSPEGRLQHAREQQAARVQRDKQILAADAAGNANVKVEAQMIRRDEETNRQRWAGTRQSPAAYDPQWMGQNVAIVGTVSRVEVDPNGLPQWVTIYFKESPDATFVVCSPYPDLFQERVGLNLSAMVGKRLEAAGQVESPYCGGTAPKGSIRVVESKQWQLR
jgi:hypothetical protein